MVTDSTTKIDLLKIYLIIYKKKTSITIIHKNSLHEVVTVVDDVN